MRRATLPETTSHAPDAAGTAGLVRGRTREHRLPAFRASGVSNGRVARRPPHLPPRVPVRPTPITRCSRPFLALALGLAVTACASGGRTASTSPRRSADVITAEEFGRTQWTNVYDLISSLRPRWLQTRGPDTLNGPPGQVQAHVNESRLGGVDALRQVPVIGVVYIQFIDPNASAARFGLGYGHGTVYVSTRPR